VACDVKENYHLMNNTDVVICEPVRAAVGGYGGTFRSLTAVDLGVSALSGLLARTGLDTDAVDDVILGHCYPTAEAPAIGRVVALDAGLPVTAAGQQVDRRCGSGLQAVVNAVLQVGSGASEVIVAGGAESMSNAPFFSADMRWGGARTGVRIHDSLARGRVTAGGANFPVPGGMIETAENLRREYAIPREEQDRLALESHRRAVAAQDAGIFAEEIVPTSVRSRSGEQVIVTDETPEDMERTNIHGSGISLGHPVGATGCRMLGTMARELRRRAGRYGLTTMCIGGGQGLAAVWERVSE
jgi:acetyl-CoA C-acetyltransferase